MRSLEPHDHRGAREVVRRGAPERQEMVPQARREEEVSPAASAPR